MEKSNIAALYFKKRLLGRIDLAKTVLKVLPYDKCYLFDTSNSFSPQSQIIIYRNTVINVEDKNMGIIDHKLQALTQDANFIDQILGIRLERDQFGIYVRSSVQILSPKKVIKS